MAVKIRLARFGRKKRPFYRIVIANSLAPRNGRFIERIGQYNPMLSRDSKDRVIIKVKRLEYWLNMGAQPTKRVAWFIKNGVFSLNKREDNEESKLSKIKQR